MIPYAKFEEYINKIIAADNALIKVAEVFGYGCWDKMNTLSMVDPMVDLLMDLFSDEEGYLSIWLFDKEHGELWDEETASDADGKPVVCKTVRQIYDFLVANERECLKYDEFGSYATTVFGKSADNLSKANQKKIRTAMQDLCNACDRINLLCEEEVR